MNKLILVWLFIGACVQLGEAQNNKKNDKMESISYAYGIQLANQWEASSIKDINLEELVAAIKDFQAGAPKMDRKSAEYAIKDAETAGLRKGGEDFLKAQALRPEVKELEQGLLYEILKEGDGPSPEPGTDVTLHYEGRLIDGTVFDSSYKRGESITFNLARLIKGWQIAVPDMKVGEKRRLYIPYNLAYGEHGAGGMIPPYAALIFDIELLGI